MPEAEEMLGDRRVLGCGRFEAGATPGQVWAFKRAQKRALEEQEKGGSWGRGASGPHGTRTPCKAGDSNR